VLSVYCCEVQLGGPSLFLALAVDQEVVVIVQEVVSYHYLVYCEYIHRISEICALRSYFVYFAFFLSIFLFSFLAKHRHSSSSIWLRTNSRWVSIKVGEEEVVGRKDQGK
jgi:hypothetical protein